MEPRRSLVGIESPSCLAYRLCRARFAGFGLGRALLAGGMMGMRGGKGEGTQRPGSWGYMVTHHGASSGTWARSGCVTLSHHGEWQLPARPRSRARAPMASSG